MPSLINPHAFRLLTQVTFGAAGAGVAETAIGALQLPYPTGIVAGSFLVAHGVTFGASVFDPAVPGWTDESAGLSISGASDVAFWWRIADGSEAGTLFMGISGNSAAGRMYRFSNGTRIEGKNSLGAGAGDTTIEAADVTTNGAKRLAVQLLLGLTNTSIGAISGESGADYTEAVAEFADGSPAVCMSCQTALVPAPTAITGGAATFGATVANQLAIGFAIVP